MKIFSTCIQPRHIIALSLTLSISSLMFFALRVPHNTPKPTTPPTPFISYVTTEEIDVNTVLLEQVALFDTEPLFLPTSFNASTSTPPLIHNTAENTLFNSLSPQLFLTQQNSISIKTLLNPPIESAIEILNNAYIKPFEHFGCYELSPPILNERTAALTIYRLDSKQLQIETTITSDQKLATTLWKPTKLIVLIDNHQLIGEPLMLNSSGEEFIDTYLQNYTNKSLDLKNMDSGYYSLTFGP